MPQRTPAAAFLTGAACLFGFAALFHLWRILNPQAADPSTALRHGVFIAINLVSAVCLWIRPPVFKYGFGLLVFQQVYSHGGSAWEAWFEHRQVDYVSLVIVVLLPATWLILWRQSPETLGGE